MATQSKLDVSKWQAARRQWQYTPVLWFYYRMIEVAYLDACGKDGDRPTDEAVLARDWIACSESPAWEPAAQVSAKCGRRYVSFPECCQMLCMDADVERMTLLEMIDRSQDCDNDESWARLEVWSASEPLDDVEPLFDAPRVVPALDQLTLFM